MAFTPQQDFMIATYASGSAALTNLEVDGTGNYSAPKFSFKPYSQQIVMGDGTVRGAGWATAEWSWDVMTATQRAWLRQFIPAQSAELWIKTRTFDSPTTGLVFRAVGIWPIASEEQDVRRPVKFQITFQRLTNS
jgi:hypothetical protein